MVGFGSPKPNKSGGSHITYKTCNQCNETRELTTDNFYYERKSSKKRGEYVYWNPKCIICVRRNSVDWCMENRERFEKRRRENYWGTAKFKAWKAKNNEEMKSFMQKWRRENKDKVKQYNTKRREHKDHEISKEEIEVLYQYSNYSCMYCGLTEEEHISLFKQRLHRDHAYNYGSNGIDNCILSCKRCNSSKHDKDWDEWYAEKNDNYNEERHMKILCWLNQFK